MGLHVGKKTNLPILQLANSPIEDEKYKMQDNSIYQLPIRHKDCELQGESLWLSVFSYWFLVNPHLNPPP